MMRTPGADRPYRRVVAAVRKGARDAPAPALVPAALRCAAAGLARSE
ncbi:hypothetical protein ACF09J_08170 [Streptomyces sp. NPDC014889]